MSKAAKAAARTAPKPVKAAKAGTSSKPAKSAEPVKPQRTIMGQTPEDRRLDRRRRLEDAAVELFGTQGFAATSIDQLCQIGSVSLRTFYDEYGTKEALFLSLYDSLLDDLRTGGAALFRATEHSEDRLRDLVAALVRALCDRPPVGRVLIIESSLLPAMQERRRATRRTIADFTELAFPELAGRRDVATGATGGLLELIADWLLHDGASPPETLVDRIVEFMDVVLAGARAEH